MHVPVAELVEILKTYLDGARWPDAHMRQMLSWKLSWKLNVATQCNIAETGQCIRMLPDMRC